jgi:hypothetical protein
MKVNLDTSKADAAMRELAKQLSAKQLVEIGHRAVNRALAAGNTEMARQVRQTVNLRAATVKDQVKVTKSKGVKAQAELRVKTDDGIALSEYGASFGKKGVTVRILKGAGRQKFANAFAVKVKKGRHAGKMRAFQREDKDTARFPIRLMLGPTVTSQAKKALPAVERRVVEILDRRIRAEIQRAIDKAGRVPGSGGG